MKRFRDFSVWSKIGGGFGVILVLVFLLAALAFSIVGTSVTALKAMTEMDNLYVAVLDVRTAVQNYQIDKDPDAAAAVAQARDFYIENAASLKNKLKFEESRIMLDEAVVKMQNYSDKGVRFMEAGGDKTAVPEIYAEYSATGQDLVKMANDIRINQPKKLFKLLGLVKNIVTGAFALVILIGLCLGLGLAHIISRDMKKGAEFVTVVADGDLTAHIDISQKDEIGRLALAMQTMVTNLDNIVIRVRETADEVSMGSREVQSSSEQVAQSATEQAAAIEEIAATIEEITATIKTTATNADDGRTKARIAKDLVSRNTELSAAMARAMEAITASSNRISDIIVTVNEVAFQTNLLALNAAVEAARAGEHGKGFAVVADEVRALAQKSATASNQIKELIETTVSKVQAGNEIVSQVAGAMGEIDATTEQLSGSMEKIAASAAEQSTGIDELNRAIAQVDNTTQTNAAVVEELAGSATNMHAQANQLLELVRKFRTSRDGS